MTSPLLDRATGALLGLALGDALGMPTQSFPRAEIARRWGIVTGLEPGPPDQPLAPGLPAGHVTDDTEQAFLLGRLLAEGKGHVDPAEFARCLTAWEDSMRSRGSLDLLGPSTKAALEKLLAGVPPAESGVTGTTNGAAMRVAPVGLVYPPGPALVDAVVEAGQVTHFTSVALAGAAAVAAAVSAGVRGADVAGAVAAAIDAARAAVGRGRWVAAADVAARLEWVVARGDWLAELGEAAFLDAVGSLVGTSLATQESVPAAFAFVLAGAEDPWRALCLAASVGGDCDTIAAMAGAVLGACHGTAAWPADAVATVERVNGLDVGGLALVILSEAKDLSQARQMLRCAQPDKGAQPDKLHTPRLVHTGNAVVDLVLRVPHLPARAGDVVTESAAARPGGGVHGLAAAAAAGVPVVYAGAHGTGPWGDRVRAALAAAGVTIATPPRPDLDTGLVVTLVEPDGERTFVTAPGAEATLTRADLDRVDVTADDWVYVTGYSLAHAANRQALLAWLPGLPTRHVVVDPGPLVATLPRDALDAVLGRAEWVSANAAEAGYLTGQSDPRAAAQLLAGPARGAVVRAGADGCWLAADGVTAQIRAVPVDVTDLNGAGDTHVGAFTAALMRGVPPTEAAAQANRAAATRISGRAV